MRRRAKRLTAIFTERFSEVANHATGDVNIPDLPGKLAVRITFVARDS
jgi:hypothetical protein